MSKYTSLEVDVDPDVETGIVGRCGVAKMGESDEEYQQIYYFELNTLPNDGTKYDPDSEPEGKVTSPDLLNSFAQLIGTRVAEELIGEREDTKTFLAIFSLFQNSEPKQADLALITNAVARRLGVCKICPDNLHSPCLRRLKQR